MKQIFKILYTLLSSIIFLSSCAPVFSDIQSARMTGKNNLELTPTGTLTNFRENGDDEKVQNSIGFQAAYGIHSKVDVRLRYERVWLTNGSIVDDGIHTIGLAPKYSILKDRIAASLLVGFAVDGAGDFGLFEIHPTMLFSLPLLNDKIDLNFSPKYLWTFDPDNENFFAFNLGLSASNDLKKWAIRPEYGLCFLPGVTGLYSQLSIGFSYKFIKPDLK